jgi:hypothetical protein
MFLNLILVTILFIFDKEIQGFLSRIMMMKRNNMNFVENRREPLDENDIIPSPLNVVLYEMNWLEGEIPWDLLETADYVEEDDNNIIKNYNTSGDENKTKVRIDNEIPIDPVFPKPVLAYQYALFGNI